MLELVESIHDNLKKKMVIFFFFVNIGSFNVVCTVVYIIIAYAGTELCGRIMLGLPVLLSGSLFLAMVHTTYNLFTKNASFLFVLSAPFQSPTLTNM